MTIPSINASAVTSLKPTLTQNPAKPSPAVSPRDADGDHDGDTSAQDAAAKKGGIDVKG